MKIISSVRITKRAKGVWEVIAFNQAGLRLREFEYYTDSESDALKYVSQLNLNKQEWKMIGDVTAVTFFIEHWYLLILILMPYFMFGFK